MDIIKKFVENELSLKEMILKFIEERGKIIFIMYVIYMYIDVCFFIFIIIVYTRVLMCFDEYKE